VATPSFVLTDLIPSTEYQINVVALTSLGPGGGAKLTATTLSSIADGIINCTMLLLLKLATYTL